MGTINYLGESNIPSGATTYTFPSEDFGAAASDRHIIISVSGRKAGTGGLVSSASIGGVEATIVAQIGDYSDGNTTSQSIIIASVPLGTTGDVVVTFNAAYARCGIGVWRATGLKSITAYDTFTDTDSAISGSIDVEDGGFVIGAAVSNGSTSASWTNLTERFDVRYTSGFYNTHSGADATFATGGTKSISCTIGSTSVAGVCASWSFANDVEVSPGVLSATLSVQEPAITAYPDISLLGSIEAVGNSTGVTSGNLDTTGATLIVLSVSVWKGGSVSSVTDNQSNTLTPLTKYTATTNSSTQLFYCISPNTSATHTFSVSGSNIWPGIVAVAFSSSSAFSYDAQNGYGNTTSTTTVQPGSITPASNKSLIISSVGLDTNVTLSVNSSLIVLQQSPWVNAVNMGYGFGYYIQPSSSSINPTWTASGNSNLASTIASFNVQTATNVEVNPGFQSITSSINSPTITAIKNAYISPSVLSGLLSIVNPTISTTQNASTTPSVLNGAFSAQDPTISTTKNVSFIPDVTVGTLSIISPSISTVQNTSISADVISSTLSIQDPSVLSVQNISTTPDAVTGTFTIQNPSISLGVGVTPGTLTFNLSIQDPTVSTIRNITVSPNTQVITINPLSPLIAAIQNTSIDPDVFSSALEIQEPTILAVKNVSVGAEVQTITVGVVDPSVSTKKNVEITPEIISVALSVLNPNVTGMLSDVTVYPETLSIRFEVLSPKMPFERIIYIDGDPLIVYFEKPVGSLIMKNDKIVKQIRGRNYLSI